MWYMWCGVCVCVCRMVILAFRSLSWEDLELEASLGYIVRCCLKRKKSAFVFLFKGRYRTTFLFCHLKPKSSCHHPSSPTDPAAQSCAPEVCQRQSHHHIRSDPRLAWHVRVQSIPVMAGRVRAQQYNWTVQTLGPYGGGSLCLKRSPREGRKADRH